MSSWKKYGGIDNFDKSNHITVNSIVADYFTIKKQFVGDFDICGNVIVGKQLVVDGVAIINGIMRTRSVDMSGDLAVNNIDCRYNGRFNNMEVNNDLKMSNSQFIYGDVSGIGINNRNPKATLDISGNSMASINVYTSNPINRSVLSHNGNHNGIALWSDNTSSYIDFFVKTDISINNTSFDGRIQYDQGGNLLLDADGYVNILPQLVISDLSADIVYNNSIVTIHGDNSSNVFNYDSYNNANVFVQNAITTVTKDNSSVMFMNIIKPDKTGFSIAGGNCPYDSTRSLGAFGFNDLSTHTFHANQTIVSGNSTVKYKTTMGINTYKPLVDKYVLDVNGPVHIKNGENNIVARSNSVINVMKFNKSNKNIGIAVSKSDGSANIPVFYTNNGGQKWNLINLYSSQSGIITAINLKTLFVYDSSYAFVFGDSLNGFYTYNGGATWVFKSLESEYSPKSMFISNTGANNARFFISASKTGESVDKLLYYDASINVSSTGGQYYNNASNSRIGNITTIPLENTNSTSVIDGYGDYIYVAGNNGIYKYAINDITLNNKAFDTSNITFTAISVFDSSYVVAVGDAILTYTKNGGNTWTVVNRDSNPNAPDYFSPENYKFSNVNIYDASNAIAVSSNGLIAYTNDGTNWLNAPTSNTFSLSGSEKMLDGSLNHVTIVDKNAFILTSTKNNPYTSNVVYNYFPDIFNHANNNVLDVSGNMNIYGNVSIIPDNTNTINITSDANVCNFLTGVDNFYIGNPSSTSKFSGNITVDGTIKAVNIAFKSTEVEELLVKPTSNLSNYALKVQGKTEIIGDIDLCGNVFIRDLSSNNLVVNCPSVFDNTVSISTNNITDALSINNGIFRSTGKVSINNGTAADIGDINNGAFYVEGHAKIQQNLYVMSNMYIGGIGNSRYSLQINSGDVNLTNNVYVNGNIFIVNKDVSFNSGLVVNGDVSFNSGLVVNGDVSFNSGVFVNGDVSFNSGVVINSTNGSKFILNTDASFNNGICVNGDASFNNGICVNGDASFNNGICVNGDASFNNGLYVNGDARFNSSLFIDGDASFNKNLVINSTNGSKLIVNADASFNSGVFVNGDARFDKNVDVIGGLFLQEAINCYSNLLVDGDASFNSKLFVNDDVSFNNNLYVGNIVYVNGSEFTSDYRIKSNIIALCDTSFSIDNLNPVFYYNKNGKKEDIGFIAHELQEYFPFLVSGEKDGEKYQSVNYNGLIGVIVNEIQILKKRIEQLEKL
jgi:photosystem II stability/assembly factor-like uncharacterized protein